MADTPSARGPEPTSTPAAVPDPASDADAAPRATPEPAVYTGPAQAPPAKAEADAESGAGPSGGSELPAVGPAAPPATQRMRGFRDRLGTKKTRLVLIGAAVVALAVPVDGRRHPVGRAGRERHRRRRHDEHARGHEQHSAVAEFEHEPQREQVRLALSVRLPEPLSFRRTRRSTLRRRASR